MVRAPRLAPALSALLMLVVCGPGITSSAASEPAPASGGTPTPTEPALPAPAEAPDFAPSCLTVPIRIPLDVILARLERESPREAGTGDAFEPYTDRKNGKEAEARCRIWRDAYELTVEDDIVEIRAAVHYRLEARGEAFGTDGCGSDAEPIDAEIGFRCEFAWGDDWSLDVRVTQIPTVHRGRCKPKNAGINFSRLLVPLVDEAITAPALALFPELVRAERQPAHVVSRAWNLIQEPVPFQAYEMWLAYRPVDVLASPVIATEDGLETEVALRVRPTLSVGDMPAVEPLPLPETKVRLYERDLRVAFNSGILIQAIEEGIPAQCAASASGYRVERARVFGGGERIGVELELDGLAASLYLTGAMAYDPATNLLAPRDLAFTAASTAMFLDAGGESGSDTDRESRLEALEAIRACIASCCSSDISPAVETYLTQLGRALNYAMSPEFAVSGGVRMRETAGVYIGHRIAGVRQLAVGHASLTPLQLPQ